MKIAVPNRVSALAALLVLAAASAASAQQTGSVPVPPPPRASAPVPPPVGQPVSQPDETAVSVPAPPAVVAIAPPGPVGPIVTVIPGAQTTIAANTPPARRSTAAPQVTLQIELDTQGGAGGAAEGGKIAVAIYQDAESFRRGEGALRTLMVDRNGPVTRAWVLGMTPGRYAIAAFHDIDGDGTLSKWAFGLPKEPYGFSNDARGRFGPPAFDAAAFDLSASGATERLELRAPIGGGRR